MAQGRQFSFPSVVPPPSRSVQLCAFLTFYECQLTPASIHNCSLWPPKKTVSRGSKQDIERMWPRYHIFTKTTLAKRKKKFREASAPETRPNIHTYS